MIKENYERTELEIIKFQTEDVIMSSDPYEYEGEIIGSIHPIHPLEIN